MTSRAASPSGSATRVATLLLAVGAAALALLADRLTGGAPGFGTAQWGLMGIAGFLGLCSLLPVSWNRSVLLAIAAFAFSGLVMEFGLRLVLGARFAPLYRFDPELLHAPIPDARAMRISPDGGRNVEIHFNSRGYRGRELSEAGLPRIAVYGDSFVVGEYAPFEETFAARLERTLGDALGRSVEVVNAGVLAYGPDQVALRLERELEGLRPDALVVSIFAGNDFGDLLRNKLFRLDPGGALQTNAFAVDPGLRRRFDWAENAWMLDKLVTRALSRIRGQASELAAKEVAAGLERDRFEYESYVEQGDNRVVNVLEDHYDWDLRLRPENRSAQHKRQLMESVLRRIATHSRAQEIPLLLLFVPAVIDLCDDCPAALADPLGVQDYARAAVSAELVAMAERQGIAFVDLYATFRDGGADALYIPGDSHWNAAGQALAAERVAQELVAMGVLSGAADSEGSL